MRVQRRLEAAGLLYASKKACARSLGCEANTSGLAAAAFGSFATATSTTLTATIAAAVSSPSSTIHMVSTTLDAAANDFPHYHARINHLNHRPHAHATQQPRWDHRHNAWDHQHNGWADIRPHKGLHP